MFPTVTYWNYTEADVINSRISTPPPYFCFLSFPQKKWGVEKRQNKKQNKKEKEYKDKLINDRVTWNANTQITNEGRTPNNITNVKLKPK